MSNQSFIEIITILNLIMKKTFYISLICLVTLEIIFLIVWSIGIFLKSEKMIKTGIRLSITIIILIVIIIVTVILCARLSGRR